MKTNIRNLLITSILATSPALLTADAYHPEDLLQERKIEIFIPVQNLTQGLDAQKLLDILQDPNKSPEERYAAFKKLVNDNGICFRLME